TSIILLNWIEFLMEKVGRNNLFDVLEYYIEIGWISEEVSSKMMAYASGIDYFVERPSWKLLPEDHTKSLLFIEQLRGKKVDKMLFSRLERDVDKIIRSSSEVTVH
ncbi:MAG: FlaD/FlaE family flagellar protein, partial [Candidatus Methanoperedens sp.]|nr:FlaD/FlaE family flagellar protein [Candidatus Methanoperedens sp.]